jgi:hypothetical protein
MSNAKELPTLKNPGVTVVSLADLVSHLKIKLQKHSENATLSEQHGNFVMGASERAHTETIKQVLTALKIEGYEY